MNIAFPALLILVLVLPGVLLRYTYRKGTWQSPIDYEPLSEEIPKSLLWTGILHLLWVAVFRAAGRPLDLDHTLVLLAGGRGEALRQAVQWASASAGWIAVYLVLIYIGAYGLGLLGHILVRRQHLDHRFRFFRFDNRWYYLLQGEHLQFSERQGAEAEAGREALPVDVVYVAAVLDQGGKSYIYYGRLLEFYFDRMGAIDILVLTDAYRRRLADDRAEGRPAASPREDSRYYGIEGDLFVIRYAEIKTLNIQYFSLEREDGG